MITKPIPGQLIAGAGGLLLIVSLFLPWAEAGGTSRSGWELWTMSDVLFLTAGLLALAAAITGGRIGLFRPDMSLNAAADLLGVLSTLLLLWLILFDFPEGAGREIGVYVALLAAAVIAGGAGDYRSAREGNMFARLPDDASRRSASTRS